MKQGLRRQTGRGDRAFVARRRSRETSCVGDIGHRSRRMASFHGAWRADGAGRRRRLDRRVAAVAEGHVDGANGAAEAPGRDVGAQVGWRGQDRAARVRR